MTNEEANQAEAAASWSDGATHPLRVGDHATEDDTSPVSLCRSCWCMTKTLYTNAGDKCGKCGADKSTHGENITRTEHDQRKRATMRMVLESISEFEEFCLKQGDCCEPPDHDKFNFEGWVQRLKDLYGSQGKSNETGN